jgi:hypothetical protein
MLKLKMIASAAIILGAVACEPLPVYPRNGPRPYQQGDPGYNPRNLPPNYDPNANPDRPPVERPPTRDEYPTAEKTDNPNQVLSPYSPYNVIDVEGFRSGQLAKDPSNGKIFRVP